MQILHFLFILRAILSHPYLIVASSNKSGPPAPRSVTFTSAGMNGLSNDYIVYPENSNNKDETEATEAFLRSFPDCEDVLADARSADIVSWRISTQDEGVVSHIGANSGVRFIQPEAPPARLIPAPAARARCDELTHQLYFASAINPTNRTQTDETRAFLEYIAADKNVWISNMHTGRKARNIWGWGNIPLDDAGLEKMKGYAGIKKVGKDRPAEYNRSLLYESKRTGTKIRNDRYQPVSKRSHIAKRTVNWKKQDRAPEDLIMDSQPSYVLDCCERRAGY
jgi:hypothetical protein